MSRFLHLLLFISIELKKSPNETFHEEMKETVGFSSSGSGESQKVALIVLVLNSLSYCVFFLSFKCLGGVAD